VLDIPRLAAALVDARGGRMRRHLRIRIPGAVGRAYRAGANLVADEMQRGRVTWREFLAAQSSASPATATSR
jgi:hypothetical protein